MGNSDFSFSLSEGSINEINTIIEQFAKDIVDLINGLQDELIDHISSANYNKLLRAVDGIIELYNDSVRKELKQSVFEKWQDACETMTSFSENMEMGEESGIVAANIEESLSNVFDVQIENRLNEVVIGGKTSASIFDFIQVKEIFSEVVKKAQELLNDFSSQIEKLSEENEFYIFLLPVITAYTAGISTYFDQSRKNLDDLEGGYLEKMNSKREAAVEGKKEVDLSNLLDFSDLAYDGIGGAIGAHNGNSENKCKGNNFSASSISSSDETPKYEELIRALRGFDGKQCTYPDLKKKYDAHLTEYRRKLDAKVKAEYDKRDNELKQYYKQLEHQLKARHKELDGRYIKGTITIQQAEFEYSNSCSRAEQLFVSKKENYWAQYQMLVKQVEQLYHSEVSRCDQIARKALENQQSACRWLYDRKKQYLDRISSDDARKCIEDLSILVNDIDRKCPDKCVACINLGHALRQCMREEDNGLVSDIKRGIDSNNAELKGFKRRKDKLSWEDNLRATNPGFYSSAQSKDKKYTHNCQRCVMAYEARCRGFDVIAKERELNGDYLPSMDHPKGWPSVFVDKNGYTPRPERLKGSSTQQAIEDIERSMKSFGDGSRAIIRIGRFADDGSRLSGHVFIAEQINGKTVFCDPQSASYTGIDIDARRNFGNYNNQVGLCHPKNILVCDPRCIKREAPATINDCDKCKDTKANRNSSVMTNVSVLPQDMRIMRIDNLKMTNRIMDCCEDRR